MGKCTQSMGHSQMERRERIKEDEEGMGPATIASKVAHVYTGYEYCYLLFG